MTGNDTMIMHSLRVRSWSRELCWNEARTSLIMDDYRYKKREL